MINNYKKIAKYIGNVLTVLAIVFIGYKLLHSDIDYNILFNCYSDLQILTVFVIYVIVLLFFPIGWLKILNTESSVGYRTVNYIWQKSNLMKYIPGNIFQFVGRNEIVCISNVGYKKVVLSTVVDYIAIFLGSVSLVTMSFFICPTFIIKTNQLVNVLNIKILVIIFLMVFILILFFLKSNKRINIQIKQKDVLIVIRCMLFYIGIFILFGLLFYITFRIIYKESTGYEELIQIIGVYQVAWMIGFITPGAPGGVGVRETVGIILLGDLFTEKVVLEVFILYRVIGVFSEVVAFGVSVFCYRLSCKKK